MHSLISKHIFVTTIIKDYYLKRKSKTFIGNYNANPFNNLFNEMNLLLILLFYIKN